MGLSEGFIGGIATLLVGALGTLQWAISERARARRRDAAMMSWGGEVIDVMSEIEGYCDFGRPQEADALRSAASRASALVDRGRLFFPNVQSQERDFQESAAESRGFRVAILDEVVRAFFVAKHLLNSPGPPELVEHLQKEMGPTLRKSSAEKTGQSVSPDPLRW
jgi:hypothetical protein